MYNHEPKAYICPFCLVVSGTENEQVETKQTDIIFRGKNITAFVASHWWTNNPGHVIIIPNKHIENIYDLPVELLTEVHIFEKQVALALKQVYKCDGISSRQHNEPYGSQDVWHYHLHVFPRYKGDDLYRSERRKTDSEERMSYACKLREYFSKADGRIL